MARRALLQSLPSEYRTVKFQAFKEGDADIEEDLYGEVGDSSGELTRIELTQAEFGDVFGLKPNSTFVKHMFKLVDSDKSGRVSFKEFLDIFILLSSGKLCCLQLLSVHVLF